VQARGPRESGSARLERPEHSDHAAARCCVRPLLGEATSASPRQAVAIRSADAALDANRSDEPAADLPPRGAQSGLWIRPPLRTTARSPRWSRAAGRWLPLRGLENCARLRRRTRCAVPHRLHRPPLVPGDFRFFPEIRCTQLAYLPSHALGRWLAGGQVSLRRRGERVMQSSRRRASAPASGAPEILGVQRQRGDLDRPSEPAGQAGHAVLDDEVDAVDESDGRARTAAQDVASTATTSSVAGPAWHQLRRGAPGVPDLVWPVGDSRAWRSCAAARSRS
jgi:hypothetical protein